MRQPLLATLTLFALLSSGALAQSAPPRFTNAMAGKIDHLGQAEINAGRTPGVAIAVVENGQPVYAQGFGFADSLHKFRISSTTQFYVGDVTREFTAAAVLLLAQDGKVKLDDKLTKYLPELTVARGITVAPLLQQTTGFADAAQLSGITHDLTRGIKPADLLAALDKEPLRFAPGSKFEYNTTNYLLAGLLVQRASGLPLSDFLQARIFQPLYMSSSFMAGDTGIAPTHAQGFTGRPHRFVPARSWDASWLDGSGGLVTDVFDLAKWDIGMPVLMRVDAVRDMFTASGVPGGPAYGMGFWIDERGGKRYVWDAGEIAGYHAMNAMLPDDHTAVIIFTNMDDLTARGTVSPENVAAQVLDIVDPPASRHMDNAITARAKEWLRRLAARDIDRTQLTARFSTYLTDKLVADSNFRHYGKVQYMVPVASYPGENGDTVYEFIVRFAKGQYHYLFTLAPENKIDGLLLKV